MTFSLFHRPISLIGVLLCLVAFSTASSYPRPALPRMSGNDTVPEIIYHTKDTLESHGDRFSRGELFTSGTLMVKFSGGLSLPVGEFASTEYGDNTAGAAKRGYSFSADVTYPLTNWFGLTAGPCISWNGVDGSVLSLPSGLTPDMGTWTTFWLFAGAQSGVAASPDVDFTGILQFGFFSGQSPEVEFSYAGSIIHQESSRATSGCWRVGIGIELRHKVFVDLRYMRANPEYTVTATNGFTTIVAAQEQPTEMWNFVIGMGF